MTETPDAAGRLREIQQRIAEACGVSGRDPNSIVLVGACKRQPDDRLIAAHDAGLRVFGENIVQEALAHQELLPDDIEWHLIGPLQSNKAAKAAATFDWIQSIDRPKIARILNRHAGNAGKVLSAMLEINLGQEPSKHGFDPERLIAECKEMVDYEHLRIEGLMAIPPYEADPEASRRWFRQLRELRDEVFSRADWSNRQGLLSMGMSADYAVAVEEGATHVRVGTALFGQREAR